MFSTLNYEALGLLAFLLVCNKRDWNQMAQKKNNVFKNLAISVSLVALPFWRPTTSLFFLWLMSYPIVFPIIQPFLIFLHFASLQLADVAFFTSWRSSTNKRVWLAFSSAHCIVVARTEPAVSPSYDYTILSLN